MLGVPVPTSYPVTTPRFVPVSRIRRPYFNAAPCTQGQRQAVGVIVVDDLARPHEMTPNLCNDAVISIQGPIREGDTIKLVSTVSPKRTFNLRVTQMQAPSRMAWSDGMPLGLFRGERTFSITGNGDGRSEFTMAEDFTGPLAGLVTKAIFDLTDSFDTFADSLKNAAEGGHGR